MITIKYEIYHNDYNRQTNLMKTFQTLDDFGNWMIDHATPYIKGDDIYHSHSYLHVDYTNFYKEFKEVGRLNSYNNEMDENYWVYLVANDEGIVYSDGTYTHGKNHASKTMLEFLHNLQERYINGEDYVFVE